MYKEVTIPDNIVKLLVDLEEEIQFYNQEKKRITSAIKQIDNYDMLLERRWNDHAVVVAQTVKQNGYDPNKVKYRLDDGKILVTVPDEPTPELVPEEPKQAALQAGNEVELPESIPDGAGVPETTKDNNE